jgi:hypothetical protein
MWRYRLRSGVDVDATVATIQRVMELLVLTGASLSAIFLGARRVYRTARNTEEILTTSRLSAAANEERKRELAEFREAQAARDERRDREMDEIRHGMSILVREVTPNGGASIKDVVNQLRVDIAVLNEWKRDNS